MKKEFNEMVRQAVINKSTDIHIIMKKECHISFRCIGDLITYKTMHKQEGIKLISYIRYISNIDMNYIWKPQTGKLVWEENGQLCALRVSSLPTYHSDSIVIRILNSALSLTIDTLSYFQDTTLFLKEMIKRRHGLFLVSGSTGSGKSTTLYTLLDTINAKQKRNIITLEDPVEVTKEYCLQIQMNENMGITFAGTLKQVLRHDPDIIMIGEIRDEQTARLAVQCALTGHLVLSTIHAGDCITTVQRLLHFGISKLDIQEVLIGTMSQIMIYETVPQKPLVLSEFMNKKQIIAYMQERTSDYVTYQKHIQTLLNDDYITQAVARRYLHES